MSCLNIIKSELEDQRGLVINSCKKTFLGRSEKHLNSECFKFESDEFGGEITIYYTEEPYCEYQLLIFKDEYLYSDHQEFASNDDFRNILRNFIVVIEKLVKTEIGDL